MDIPTIPSSKNRRISIPNADGVYDIVPSHTELLSGISATYTYIPDLSPGIYCLDDLIEHYIPSLTDPTGYSFSRDWGQHEIGGITYNSKIESTSISASANPGQIPTVSLRVSLVAQGY